jgi:hypothetical protein
MQGGLHTTNDLVSIDYIGKIIQPEVSMDRIFTFPARYGGTHVGAGRQPFTNPRSEGKTTRLPRKFAEGASS